MTILTPCEITDALRDNEAFEVHGPANRMARITRRADQFHCQCDDGQEFGGDQMMVAIQVNVYLGYPTA